MKLAEAAGRRVIAVYSGARRSISGPEFKGISTDTWVYAHLLLKLDDGRYLSLEPGACELLAEAPPELHDERLVAEEGETAIGRTVEDIVVAADDEPDVAVLLSGGYKISHYYLPGGSHYSFDRVSADDIASYKSIR